MNHQSKQNVIIWIIIAIIISAAVWLLLFFQSKPGTYDTFAKCLKDKGAVFYGAFWCPHCQNQKAMFGKSEKHLPYVECSTPDGKSQLSICKDKNIDGYPTWVFADGSRESGEVSLENLADKTGCSLPQL